MTKKDTQTLQLSRVETTSCDVTFVASEERIPCHRSVLTRHSSVFRAMLNSDFKEGVEGNIVIEDFPASVLRTIIEFLRTGDVIIDNNWLAVYFRFAEKYDFVSLRNACEQFIIRNMTTDNVVVYHRIAQEFNCIKCTPKLEDRIVKMLPKSGQPLDVNQPIFLEWGMYSVVTYLSSKNLVCDSELQVLEALCKWFLHDEAGRFKDEWDTAQIMCQCIDQSQLTEDDVTPFIASLGLEEEHVLLKTLRLYALCCNWNETDMNFIRVRLNCKHLYTTVGVLVSNDDVINTDSAAVYIYDAAKYDMYFYKFQTP